MILYHFTDFYALENAGPEAILKAGIKAHDPNGDYPMFSGKLRPCVWLTSAPELPEMFYSAGGKECRIAVELSTVSKRLVSWPKLLRKTMIFNETATAYDTGIERFERMERDKSIRVDLGRDPTEAELKAWRHWYVHFGDIPLKAIREVNYADPKRRAEREAEIASGAEVITGTAEEIRQAIGKAG